MLKTILVHLDGDPGQASRLCAGAAFDCTLSTHRVPTECPLKVRPQ